MDFPIKKVIFHSYVSLPEGKRSALEMCPSTSFNILRPSLGTSIRKQSLLTKSYKQIVVEKGAEQSIGTRAGKSKTTSWVYTVVEHHNLQLARDLPQRFRHEVN